MTARCRLGMTLIEVLLAVAIAGTSLVILATGSARCAAVFVRSREYQEAQWHLGQGELDYPLYWTNDVVSLAVDDITYGNGFVFSRQVEEQEDEESLFIIRSSVRWKRGSSEFKEEVVRYVLQAP